MWEYETVTQVKPNLRHYHIVKVFLFQLPAREFWIEGPCGRRGRLLEISFRVTGTEKEKRRVCLGAWMIADKGTFENTTPAEVDFSPHFHFWVSGPFCHFWCVQHPFFLLQCGSSLTLWSLSALLFATTRADVCDSALWLPWDFLGPGAINQSKRSHWRLNCLFIKQQHFVCGRK